jgi:hypothetical protein
LPEYLIRRLEHPSNENGILAHVQLPVSGDCKVLADPDNFLFPLL